MFVFFATYQLSTLGEERRFSFSGYSNPTLDRPKSTKQVHCSDSSTAKNSAIYVSVADPRRWPLKTDAPCHSRRGTLKNRHCSMAMIECTSSVGQNLKPFTGDDDASIWIKKSREGRSSHKLLAFCNSNVIDYIHYYFLLNIA